MYEWRKRIYWFIKRTICSFYWCLWSYSIKGYSPILKILKILQHICKIAPWASPRELLTINTMWITAHLWNTWIVTIDYQHRILHDIISNQLTKDVLPSEQVLNDLLRRLVIHYTTEEVVLLLVLNKESLEYKSHRTYHEWILCTLKSIINKIGSEDDIMKNYRYLITALGRDDTFDSFLYAKVDENPATKLKAMEITIWVQNELEALFHDCTISVMCERYLVQE